jgi:hypothetical protein
MIFDDKIIQRKRKLTEVEQDMNAVIEEMQLLLITACQYDHKNKMLLIEELKRLRGVKPERKRKP